MYKTLFLVAFRILFIISILIITSLGGCLFEVHLIWDLLCFLNLDIDFLLQVREIFNHNFFKYTLDPLLCFSACNANVGILKCFFRALLGCFHLIVFPVCSADWLFYIFLFSSSLMHSSVSLCLLLIPSSVFISATELFIFTYVFFISSSSLLKC